MFQKWQIFYCVNPVSRAMMPWIKFQMNSRLKSTNKTHCWEICLCNKKQDKRRTSLIVRRGRTEWYNRIDFLWHLIEDFITLRSSFFQNKFGTETEQSVSGTVCLPLKSAPWTITHNRLRFLMKLKIINWPLIYPRLPEGQKWSSENIRNN